MVCVSRGTEAAKLIKKLGFDLIISDIVMPGHLNGIDVLRITKETDPLCPVLAITGNFDSETVARLMSLGVESYIPKPFSGDLILSTVAKALEIRDLRKTAAAKK